MHLKVALTHCADYCESAPRRSCSHRITSGRLMSRRNILARLNESTGARAWGGGPPKAVEVALRASNVDRIHPHFGSFVKRTIADQWHNSRRENFRIAFCSHPPPLAHNLLTVLTGPGAHRVSGRTAVTSRRGFGIHVSEGVRRAGVPAAGANAWVAGLRSIRAYDHETSVCNPRGSMETACDRPTGRQTPAGRGSCAT
jgi:hypothetical protein